MLLRKFKANDAFEVSSLIKRSIMRRDNRGYTIDNIYSIANYYSPDTLLLDLNEKEIYVAIEDGKIIGTGAIKEDELMTLFIEPNCQSKGIGSSITDILEKIAISKGFNKIWCISTISAVSFYEKLGYKFIGEKIHPFWGKGLFVEKTLK